MIGTAWQCRIRSKIAKVPTTSLVALIAARRPAAAGSHYCEGGRDIYGPWLGDENQPFATAATWRAKSGVSIRALQRAKRPWA
jgi:hypothetical protein